jgi:hypothetical protein
MSETLHSSDEKHPWSEEEQKRFREIFAPTAKECRSASKYAQVFLGIGMVVCLSCFTLPKGFMPWAAGIVVICWLIVLSLKLSLVSVDCPACRCALNSPDFGDYCPECGAGKLVPAELFRAARCNACHKRFVSRSRRNYKIRACTHCGLILDEKVFRIFFRQCTAHFLNCCSFRG